MEWDNTYQDSMYSVSTGHFGAENNISPDEFALTDTRANPLAQSSYNLQRWQLIVSVLLLGVLIYLNFIKKEEK